MSSTALPMPSYWRPSGCGNTITNGRIRRSEEYLQPSCYRQDSPLLKTSIIFWGDYSKPRQIRCDNGPEYISAVLARWAEDRGIELCFIQPGNPQQNAYVERYNRTVRYDWFSQHLFESIAEVQDHATRWLWTYNNERPNMGLGGITPMQKLALDAYSLLTIVAKADKHYSIGHLRYLGAGHFKIEVTSSWGLYKSNTSYPNT